MATPTVERQGAAPPVWPEQGQWTFDDWLRLPDDEFRYELIEGELFVSPPPTVEHQNTISNLLLAMRLHAQTNGLGLVLTSPVGVRLPGETTIVEPDVLFVSRARQEIIGNDYIDGAPDLIVEVLSPSNWMFDRGRKQETYRRAGVSEYWIIDYRARAIDVIVLETESGQYAQRGHYGEGDTAVSEVLVGFSLPVAGAFVR